MIKNKFDNAIIFMKSLDRVDLVTVQNILDAGADPNQMLPSGNTPFHFAVGRANVALLEMLILAGARPDVKDDAGVSARELAEEIANRHGGSAIAIADRVREILPCSLDI